jgi:hypothetical protein
MKIEEDLNAYLMMRELFVEGQSVVKSQRNEYECDDQKHGTTYHSIGFRS